MFYSVAGCRGVVSGRMGVYDHQRGWHGSGASALRFSRARFDGFEVTSREDKKREWQESYQRHQAELSKRAKDARKDALFQAISERLHRLTESEGLDEAEIVETEAKIEELISSAERFLDERKLSGRIHEYDDDDKFLAEAGIKYYGYKVAKFARRQIAESPEMETGGAGRNWKPEGPDDLREPQKDLQDEDLKAKIIAKLDELSGQKLSQLWAFLADPQPIPTEPPRGQLYENRPDKSEQAPDFIQRVYGDFLKGEFTRADLRRVDPGAMIGLKNWEARFGRFDLLPTKKELNDKLLETPQATLSLHERIAQKRIQTIRINNSKRK